jgi:CHAT domain-containing protein/tetratricopeptide (TPR) repeat protein
VDVVVSILVGLSLLAARATQDPVRSAPTPSPCPSAAQFDARIARSQTEFDAGRTDAGMSLLRTVRDDARAEMCVRYEAEALRRLAIGHNRTRAFAAGRDKLERAVALFREAGDRADEAQSLVQLGYEMYALGKPSAAVEPLLRARELFMDLHDPKGMAAAYDHLMYVLPSGPQKAALRAEAVALVDAHPELKDTGCNIVHQWGDELFTAGKYNEAYGKLTAAIACFSDVSDKSRLGRALVSLGRVYRAHGRLDLALAQYTRAVKLQQEAGDREAAVQSLNAIAVTLGFMGAHDESLARLREALAIAETFATTRMAEFLRANVAGAYLDLGRYREAARALEEILTSPDTPLESARRGQLARAYLGMGQPTRALAQADRAVATADGPGGLTDALNARAAAFTRLRRFDDASRDLQRALDAIETQRTNTVPDDFLKRGFGQQYEDVYAAQVSLFFARHEPRKAFDTAEQARGRAFLDLLAARSVQLPDRERIAAAPATVSGAIATARRLHSTILEYWVAPEATSIWAIGEDGAIVARQIPVTASRLTSLVREATGIARGDAQPSGTLVTGASMTGPWRELYQLLVEPIHASLPARRGARLTIVPHGPLFGLPFAALRDGRDRYLIETYEIHYVPAVGVLDYTSRARPSRDASALLVGDPSAALAGDALNVLPAVPWARKEVDAIVKLLPGRKTVLLGDEASETNVRQQLRGRTLLHFATHGIVRNTESLDSYLALHPSGTRSDEDGRLTANETYALELDADLVVLSGCRTALGPISGDGVMGFTRAFLAAGAASVVATMWDVPDRTSFEAMRSFYTSWTAGRRPGASLRDGQLALLRALRAGRIRVDGVRLPESPRLWAGFALVGEP